MRFRRLTAGRLELVIGVKDESGQGKAKPTSAASRRLTPAASTVAVTEESRDKKAALEAEIASVPSWYHTIDLGNGVATPGCFDHRTYLPKYPIPAQMQGMKVLDCATFDGYWAFEFERRGADVTALDVPTFRHLDLPPAVKAGMTDAQLDAETGTGFNIVHKTLDSKVKRKLVNLYDLSPEKIGGTFDMVFSSDVLLHLMNPMKALQNIRSVTKEYALIVEWYHPAFPDTLVAYKGGQPDCTWWTFSFGGIKKMIEDAGFSDVQVAAEFDLMTADGTGVLRHAAFLARP